MAEITRKVGRPALGKDKKCRLNLTVSEEERIALDAISKQTGQSVSELVGAWAVKESRRLARKATK